MPSKIIIDTLNGVPPFNIYTCDTGFTTCIYINTISLSDIPYEFEVPVIFEDMGSYGLKVVDNTDCLLTDILT